MPFADELLGSDVARELLRIMRVAAPDADLTALERAPETFGDLALGARSDLLRDALLTGIPGDYRAFATTIRRAAEDPALTGWMIWAVTCAVTLRADIETDIGTDGSTEASNEAFDDGMALIAELTGRLTAEWAIRTPLRRDFARGLQIVLGWTTSPDEHVRRLASEGTRPYLPWGVRVPAVIENPQATIPVLNALYRDESEYVRRSVANHLNDVSRHAPDLVISTARAWMAAPDENTPATVKHALRTLVKQGRPEALEILGFRSVDVTVDGPRVDRPVVAVGESVRFTADVHNTGTADANLVIDYIVHHTKANGSQTSKTFKLTTTTLPAGEYLSLARDHSFRVITTRTYHPGPHAIELQVNGVRHGRADFDLVTAG